MNHKLFQSGDQGKLEIVSIDSANRFSDEDVRIDFSVGCFVADNKAEPVKPASKAEAIILKDAVPLRPAVSSKHILSFKEIMRLDVFDTESRFMADFAGPWADFQRVREDIPGILIGNASNYIDSMKFCDALWDGNHDIFHTHVTTFGSSVVNVLSWDRPIITDVLRGDRD